MLYKGRETRCVMLDSHNDFEVGDVLTYPVSHGFRRSCRIPEAVAKLWIQLEEFDFNNYSNEWMNKMALVVDVEDFSGKAVALYNHDGKYFVTTRERR